MNAASSTALLTSSFLPTHVTSLRSACKVAKNSAGVVGIFCFGLFLD